MPTVVLHPLEVDAKPMVRISVPKDLTKQSLGEVLEPLGAYYDEHWKAFLIPACRGIVSCLFKAIKPIAWVDYSAYHKNSRSKPASAPELAKEKPYQPSQPLPSQHQEALKAFSHFLDARGYAINTKRTYLSMISCMLEWFSDRQIDELENADLNRFFSQYVVANGYSTSFQRQMIGAIKLFYRKRPEALLDLERVRYPRKSQPLPKILSVEEIGALLSKLTNLKHRSLVALQYGCGLRVSELLSLRLEDLWLEEGLLFIRNSKGNKDRRVKLSAKLKEVIQQYLKAYAPETLLFEGQNGGQYSASSVNQVLKQAAQAAGIKRQVSSHMLRHSYATHLMDRGIDLRIIQELLGHKSSRTTEIYTHVSQRLILDTPSPFDFLDESASPKNKSSKPDDNPQSL